ncbi:hypothetical protein EBQ81_00635, partial [bacterium]|nr:hypothetical protein [bacterium]
MTAWDAVYRVKINGTIVTNATLAGLTITSGRTSIYSQPIAGYCNLNLIETNENAISYEINDSVTVEIKDSTGTFIYLFGGFITDINITVQSSGSNAITQKVNIIGVGALARLNRSTFSGNLSHQFDGDRISYLLGLVLFDAWNEVPASLTWATYDATTTWANAENSGYGEIDTPGDYELHSQTDISDTIYNLVSGAANSGLGYVYEDAQGRIGYADSTHRSEYLSANGYVDLDGNHAFGPALQISKRAGDVRNSVTIAYGADSANTVTDSDPDSIALYGQLASNIITTLRHQADAEDQAAFYLLIRAYPQFEMKQISFPLASSEIDNSDRDALLNVFMGQPLNITNLPANMVNG